jgi:bifunctional UDP-N-acetylglucosamine pyrophosphorylase / glucosamine-1-phosphate N-acetyltransferase
LPKALVSLNGRPLISYLAESVSKSGVDDSPIVVVSPENKEIISAELSQYNLQYAIQAEQLGTGHAVACAKDLIPADCDNIVVLYCDHPFITAESIRQVAQAKTAAVTVMPAELGDYNDWRFNFYRWGRMIRNSEGKVEKIVEFKDASEEEIKVTEVNPGFMCFNSEWLWENIEKLRNDNKQKEYYLTSLVEIAFSQGHEVGTIVIGAKEAMGINSRDELLIAESINL